MLHQFTNWYIEQMNAFGLKLYVFLGMTIESSFIPFPSEIIMPPAGHQAGTVSMLILLISIGTLGSLIGAWINYSIGYFLGRPFLLQYGKYIFIKEAHIKKMDYFWEFYGEGSTFICRFIPGVRQLISIPAGMSKMNFFKFSFYTGLGALLWVSFLALCGWFLRDWSVQELETSLKAEMLPYVLGVVLLLIGGYVLMKKRNGKNRSVILK